MKKRGQVTIFIVIGLVLVLVIGLVYYFSVSSASKKGKADIISTTQVSDDILEIKNNLNSCLEEKSSEALEYISFYGGYIYNTPKYIEPFRGNDVAYAYYQGEFIYPKKKQMEEEMKDYLVDNFESCINTEAYSYVFEIKEPKVTVTIDEDKVNFKIQYSFTLTKDKSSYDVSDKYEFKRYVRLGYLYILMQNITAKEKELGYIIDMDYLFSLNTKIYIYELDNKTLIYRLADLPERPYKDYNFTFANKF